MKKPTIEEIRKHIDFKGIGAYVEAETFFWHYEAKGWMVGKNPMKKWRASVSGWASREKRKMGPKTKTAKVCKVCGEPSIGMYRNALHCSKTECKKQIRGW